MRYDDLLKRVMKGRFVMLLADFEGCRIGAKCEKDEGVAEEVERSYLNVGRDMREGFDDFGREAISAQNIGFFGVEADEIGEVSNVIGEVGDSNKAAKGEVSGEGIATDV